MINMDAGQDLVASHKSSVDRPTLPQATPQGIAPEVASTARHLATPPTPAEFMRDPSMTVGGDV